MNLAVKVTPDDVMNDMGKENMQRRGNQMFLRVTTFPFMVVLTKTAGAVVQWYCISSSGRDAASWLWFDSPWVHRLQYAD